MKDGTYFQAYEVAYNKVSLSLKYKNFKINWIDDEKAFLIAE